MAITIQFIFSRSAGPRVQLHEMKKEITVDGDAITNPAVLRRAELAFVEWFDKNFPTDRALVWKSYYEGQYYSEYRVLI